MARVLLSQDLPDKVVYKFLLAGETAEGFSPVATLDRMPTSNRFFVGFFLDGTLASTKLGIAKSEILKGVPDKTTIRFHVFCGCGTIEVQKLQDLAGAPDIAKTFVPARPYNRKSKPSSPVSPASSSSSSSSPSSSSDEEDNPIPVKPSSSIKTQKFEFPGKKFITVEAEILDEDTMKSLDVEDDLVMGLGNLINDIQKGAKLHRTNTVVLTLFKTMCTINSLADETDMEPQIFYHTLNSLTQK